MPQLIPYMLAFKSGLHVGTRGVNLEEADLSIHSDTLLAAMVDTWQRNGGNAQDLAAPFTTAPPDPPFLLTSAFPYAGQVRFYPMPIDVGSLFSAATLKERSKPIKRIRFLSEALLRKALQGEPLDEYLFPDNEHEEPQRGLALQGGGLWLTVDEVGQLPLALQRGPGKRRALRYLKVWSADRVPRVTVGRITSASNIFYAGRVTLAEGCGLWFGVAWRAPDRQVGASQVSFEKAFLQVLTLLQHDGLGGERTTGYGAFTFSAEATLALQDPTPGKPSLLLSRYHPREDELPQSLAAEGTAYDLTAVAGWVHSLDGADQRRKRLNMVAEGSVVCPPAFPAGDMIDIRPEYKHVPGLPHPVYRYGLALAVGWPSRAHHPAKEADHA